MGNVNGNGKGSGDAGAPAQPPAAQPKKDSSGTFDPLSGGIRAVKELVSRFATDPSVPWAGRLIGIVCALVAIIVLVVAGLAYASKEAGYALVLALVGMAVLLFASLDFHEEELT
jgi:hypothetical protein